MVFGQSASNTALFVYQFVLPFAAKTAKPLRLKQHVSNLVKQEPGKHKGKQMEFKKLYVKIWQQILEILRTDSAVRAYVHYIPILQLIRELDIYIDPESLLESTMFFKIDQDSEGITVSLECLENLLACANELLQAWRETRGDAPSNAQSKPPEGSA